MCTQRGVKSKCASVQSDLILRCPHEETLTILDYPKYGTLPDTLELETDITLNVRVTFLLNSSSDLQHLTPTVTVSPAGMQLKPGHVLLQSEAVHDFFIMFISENKGTGDIHGM